MSTMPGVASAAIPKPRSPRASVLVTPANAPGMVDVVSALLTVDILPTVAVSDEHRDRLVSDRDFDVVVHLTAADPGEAHRDGRDDRTVIADDVVATGSVPGTVAWALQIAVEVARRVAS